MHIDIPEDLHNRLRHLAQDIGQDLDELLRVVYLRIMSTDLYVLWLLGTFDTDGEVMLAGASRLTS
jgi:hypothetical protein